MHGISDKPKIDVDFSLLPHLFETRDAQEAARETRASTLTKAVSGGRGGGFASFAQAPNFAAV